MPVLPQEILEACIDEAASGRYLITLPTLIPCLSVSRVFRRRAKYHIFSWIFISTDKTTTLRRLSMLMDLLDPPLAADSVRPFIEDASIILPASWEHPPTLEYASLLGSVLDQLSLTQDTTHLEQRPDLLQTARSIPLSHRGNLRKLRVLFLSPSLSWRDLEPSLQSSLRTAFRTPSLQEAGISLDQLPGSFFDGLQAGILSMFSATPGSSSWVDHGSDSAGVEESQHADHANDVHCTSTWNLSTDLGFPASVSFPSLIILDTHIHDGQSISKAARIVQKASQTLKTLQISFDGTAGSSLPPSAPSNFKLERMPNLETIKIDQSVLIFGHDREDSRISLDLRPIVTLISSLTPFPASLRTFSVTCHIITSSHLWGEERTEEERETRRNAMFFDPDLGWLDFALALDDIIRTIHEAHSGEEFQHIPEITVWMRIEVEYPTLRRVPYCSKEFVEREFKLWNDWMCSRLRLVLPGMDLESTISRSVSYDYGSKLATVEQSLFD